MNNNIPVVYSSIYTYITKKERESPKKSPYGKNCLKNEPIFEDEFLKKLKISFVFSGS
jgi:hypothetical protein